MKRFFETWRSYLREGGTTTWVRSGPMADKASEKNIIGGREAQQSGVNIIDFDPASVREIAQELADKLDAQLGEELGRGAMGVVYEIRAEGGEGADMILKVTQFPHEKRGYTLTRWKKRELAQNPELASILPDIGKVVDVIYDFKEGWFRGRSIKIYGIPVERLEPLPPRIKEQLFGHRGSFKNPEAEKEWIQAITDPKLLIPVLRETFSDDHTIDIDNQMHSTDGEREYAYFEERMDSGIEFEKEVLDLEPPRSFQDYLTRWLPQISRRAVRRAQPVTKYSSARPTPDRIIQRQSVSLAKRLEGRIKIPQYPPESLKYFSGIEGGYPRDEAPGPVADFFSKLMKLKDYGVDFWDTHSDNVMMRPLTNEIVVSDVGLFKQPKEN